MQGISRLAVSGGEDAISTHCWKTEAGRRVPAEDGLGPPLHMCFTPPQTRVIAGTSEDDGGHA